MAKLQLITSKKSNRYQHIKWLLSYLNYSVEVIDTTQFSKHRLSNPGQKIKNPTLIDPETDKLVQGENAIMTYAVLKATENTDNSKAPSKERTLLGYSCADVLQIESLLEILTEI